MTTEEILSKLSKKTRDRVLRASEIKIDRLPWSSVGLTAATGGLARGRIHLLYGPKSAGKSLLSMTTAGEWQERGLTVAVIDSEGTTDPKFISQLGVDPDKLLVTHDKSFYHAGENAAEFLKAGVDLLIVDSYSTLVPDEFLEGEELKGSDGQKQIGAFSKACKKLFRTLHYNNENTAIIAISHVTMSFGAMHASMIPEGGKAVEHGSSQIIRMTASAAEKQQIMGQHVVGDKIFERPIGREVSLLVEKNKLGLALGKAQYNMYYGGENVGIDTYEETVSLAVDFGVIEKGGAWYNYQGEKYQGSNNVAKMLRDNDEVFAAVKAKIVEASK